ncbi:MAG TPA: DUF4189 domain-containing protein [Kofleriaceae bacterium]
MRKLLVSIALLVASTGAASAARLHHHRSIQQGGEVAPPPVTAGAIYYSPSTNTIAWSYGQSDQETATQAALNACGYADCEFKVSEIGASAVFVQGDNGQSAWSWDYTLEGAKQNALEACSKITTNCTVQRTVTN